MGEYDNEPIRGLPDIPPAGETILSQGAPDWETLARHAFHLRGLAVYFAVLVIWLAVSAVSSGPLTLESVLPVVEAAALSGFVIGLLTLFAWLIARTTVYTITSKRVVMRFGIALPMTLNLPFARIESAGLKTGADGNGDIPLLLLPSERMAYLVMWPHVRPWQFKRSQPMLRSIPDAASVAQILARALAAAADQPAQSVPSVRVTPAVQGAGPHAAAAA
jgi:hypothetical protein